MPLKKLVTLKDFLHELVTKEVKIFIALLILFASSLVFLQVAGEMSSGKTGSLDKSVIKFFRMDNDPSKSAGPGWVNEFMVDITSLGGGNILALITVLVSIFLILQKHYDAFWLLLGATIGGALLSFGLKEIYGRERPDLVYRLVEVNSLSFPSGHSMMSAVLYLTQAAIIARFQREWKVRIFLISTALFLTFIIGLSRVYLGVHYPTDVIGGWTIGLAWASFCWCIVWYLQRKKRF